ncbi:hypothetical protein B0I35DRAFT_413850 [Stachybotrys elegans]|uniref:Ecp2 effector protein domain-containing protein n=1 Tax=Stachybotrys elegans TaxID=80388 RepID=A0A8K0SG88_9HYPO|nr:hypothetical protein B0I35DRAFT_413850 [Stachybotrys elegans]
MTRAVALFLALATVAQAMPAEGLSASDALAGKTISDIDWAVQAFPGGEVLHMTGTVETVWAKLLAINPNYVADWGIEDPVNETENVTLEKRTDFTGSALICRKDVSSAHFARQGIAYLRRISGQPTNGAGPANCGRVSCSERTAIWWCNDTTSPKTLASFGSIADGAQWIVDRCSWVGDSGVYSYTAGQVFHSTNWNVIITTANC